MRARTAVFGTLGALATSVGVGLLLVPGFLRGLGPVDAAVSAVREAIGSAADAQLDDYHVDAITGGTDAVVTVEVRMSRGDHTVSVAASDSDITSASVTAMVDAIDRLVAAEPDRELVADD